MYSRHMRAWAAPLALVLSAGAAATHGVPVFEGAGSYYVTTIAGDGLKGHVDGKGAGARFNWPTGVAVSRDGALYVADYSNNLIRRVDAGGFVTTVAGSTEPGYADGTGAGALLWGPDNIAADALGNVYVADADNFRIRKVSEGGVVTTVAGSGVMAFRDGKAGYAAFGYPTGIAVDDEGVLYVADRRTNSVRKINAEGVVTTLAGNGLAGFRDAPGLMARFREPVSVAVGAGGAVYVADSGNNAIRRVGPDGSVTTVAGGRMKGYRDGRGSEAMFAWPTGIALDMAGNLYVCDSANNKIRRVTPEGVVSTIAGGLVPGSADGPGLGAGFNFPTGIVVGRDGDIYVADSGNNRIRKIIYRQLWTGAAPPLDADGRRAPEAGRG